MAAITNFIIAFVLSFAGSMPPGAINLTVVQMGLEGKTKAALRFSLAAAAIEYPYAWIAVKFERLITSSPSITENLTLFTALVLIALGLVNLLRRRKKNIYPEKFSNSGFRKGLLLGIFNPLAIPYWVGVTAYFRSQNWIELSTSTQLHSYLTGIVCGGFVLLILLTYLSKKVMQSFNQYPWIQSIPGFVLFALGLYSLLRYFI